MPVFAWTRGVGSILMCWTEFKKNLKRIDLTVTDTRAVDAAKLTLLQPNQ